MCFAVGGVTAIESFIKNKQQEGISNIQEWLKYAVIQAEAALGSGTGQIKLRYVYDKAVAQFPWMAKTISFEQFSSWVDLALEWMRDQIENNKKIKELVDNE